MAEWIDFIHPPRDNFAATMSDDERRVWTEHFDRLKRLLAEGVMSSPARRSGWSTRGS